MSNENNKFQNDIDNLFKQNVNDLLSIKELYKRIEELGEKTRQIKYIDNTLVKKLKKEYDKLKKIILDENIQVKLTNEIETINSQMDTIDIKTKYVTYEMFGAKLDGVTDDSNAIIKCHDYANEHHLPIIQNGGIIKCNFTVDVKTSCNLNVDFLVDNNTPNTIYKIVSDNEKEFSYSSAFTSEQVEFNNIFKGKFFVPRLDNDTWLLGTRSMETDGKNYYHRQPIAVDKNGVLISSPIYLGNEGNFTIKYCKDLSEKSITFSGGRVITSLSKIGFPRLVKCSRNNTIIQNITIENKQIPSLTENYPSGLIEIVGCANITINNIFGTNNAVNTTDGHSYIIDITDAYNVNISNCNLTQGWGVIATHFVDNISIINSTINRVDNHYGLFGSFKFCNSTLTGVSALCAGYGNGDFIVDNISVNKTLNGSFIFYTRKDFNITYSGTLSLNKIKFVNDNFDRLIEYQLGSGTANSDLSKGKFNIIATEISTNKTIINNTSDVIISAQLFNCNCIPATSTSKANIDIFNSKVSQLSSTGTIKLINSTLNSIKKYDGTLYIFSGCIYANINNNLITIYATSCLIGNNITGKSLYLIGCYSTSPKIATGNKVVLESCVNITKS